MADEQVDILIRTQAETSGAQRAAESLGKVEAAVGKTAKASTQLKDAFRGLSLQFPLLAQAASMMVNPITASVLAIVAAFALWRKRVDELTRSLAGFELPNIKIDFVGRVTAAANAWREFGLAISQASEHYKSATADSDRLAASIKRQADAQMEILKQQRALDMARLDAQRDSMGEGDYAVARQALEDRYGQAGLNIKEIAAQRELSAKYGRRANLILEARRKMGMAGEIRLGSSADDDKTEAELAKQAELAQKDIASRQGYLGMLGEMQSGGFKYWLHQPKAYYRWGPFTGWEEARRREEGGIADSQAIIGRYNSFRERRAGRDAARARRDSLTSGAASAAVEAFGLDMSLPGEEAAMRQESAVRQSGAATDSAVGWLGALATTNQQRANLAQQILSQIESGNQTDTRFAQGLLRLSAQQQDILQRIARAEQLIANTRSK